MSSGLRKLCWTALIALLASLVARPASAMWHHARAPRTHYHPSRLVVRFDRGTSPEQARVTHALFDARAVSQVPLLGVDIVELPPEADPMTVARSYQSRPAVSYAHPDWRYRVQDNTPNDVLFPQQWNLRNVGQMTIGNVPAEAGSDIDAPEAWESAFGPRSFPSAGGVRVAVIDTGVDANHLDLAGKVSSCWSAYVYPFVNTSALDCFDGDPHGTAVSGIIAAQTNNTLGISGVAPNADIASVRTFLLGFAFSSDIIQGIHHAHAVAGARVINMSFAGPYEDPSMQAAIREAHDAGTVLVAAAGNRGDSYWYPLDCPTGPSSDCLDQLRYPASYPGVISVGATDAADDLSVLTVCNEEVDLVAPGHEVLTTGAASTYTVASGTSFSAPHVAGAAALLRWQHPDASPDQIEQMLLDSADDRGSPGRDPCFGAGRLNLGRAVTLSGPPDKG